jgi:hypothetical protein
MKGLIGFVVATGCLITLLLIVVIALGVVLGSR